MPARLLGGPGPPGDNESAGRARSTRTRSGSRYLKGALGVAAPNIARNPEGNYLGARYKRIVVRRGKTNTIGAVEHSIPTAAWHMLAEGEYYHEPGADFCAQ